MLWADKQSQIRSHVLYWGFLLLKLAVAVLISGALLALLNFFWTPRTPFLHLNRYQFIFDLGYTTLAGLWFLISYGLCYLVFWDQRYRCRTCLRRLLMPVETGSWSHMLRLGRPKMEYICAFGHGTLNIDELQITGSVPPGWKEHGDMWSELFAAPAGKDEER